MPSCKRNYEPRRDVVDYAGWLVGGLTVTGTND